MKEIVILCGLPRSGKSTWIEQHKREFDIVVSADDLRYLVYNQKFWNDGEPLMWSVRGILLRMLMQQSKSIIIDETNTTKARRKPLIDLAKKHGYYVTCNVVQTTPETCLTRAYNEGNHELADVIRRMMAQFELPEYDEGINEINMV